MQIAAQYNPIILTNSQEQEGCCYPVLHNNGWDLELRQIAGLVPRCVLSVLC